MKKLFRSPYRIVLLSLVIALVVFVIRINQVSGGLLASLDWIFMDGLICGLGLFFWLLFFSQFVLPVRKLGDRYRVFERLNLYIQGGHGPAIFIENGKIRKRKGEMKRKGPGVIVLDTASAAVLRTPEKFTRAVGPGVVFTDTREYLENPLVEDNKAVVDLRPQKQTIGPVLSPAGYQDAQHRNDTATMEAYQQQRRETRGLTRDGIEIVPKITVYFKINARPGEKGSKYGYNPQAVERAILGRNIDANLPPDKADRVKDWNWLPAYIAADVWKESISKFTLDELFTSEANKESALQIILSNVEQRLTRPRVPILDGFGKPTGEEMDSEEYKLMTARGIKVQRIEIRDLEMPEAVERQIVKRWKTSWLNQAKKDKEDIETLRGYITEEGREQALSTFAVESAASLAGVPAESNLSGGQILSRLLKGTLELTERDPQIHQSLTDETQQIRELIAWAEKEDAE